ncbi:hypothetical protein CCP3SC1AL1_650007 [Gammaproteobacteria bacterium]
MSLACLESGCISREIRLTVASKAELINSTKKTNNRDKISSKCSILETGKKREMGTKNKIEEISRRIALSC